MILVTGATGLVGTHLLIQLVKEKVPIRALYRTEKKKAVAKKVFVACAPPEFATAFDQIDWIQADITDIILLQTAFEGVTHVYHCAALISFNPSYYKKLRKVNIEGTANIVNQCILHQVKKLCYVSSIAVFGEDSSGKPIDEMVDWNPELPHSVYAITKYGAEMEIWRGTQEGLDAVIVNPGVIIGQGFFESGSGFLFKKINKGMSYYTTGTTGYIAVQDVVNCMILLMESNIINERYIVVAENLSFKDMFSRIAISLNKPVPTNKVSRAMMTLGYYIQSIGSVFGGQQYIFKASIKSAFSNPTYCSDKIKKELDYNFIPISKAVKDTATFFSKNR